MHEFILKSFTTKTPNPDSEPLNSRSRLGVSVRGSAAWYPLGTVTLRVAGDKVWLNRSWPLALICLLVVSSLSGTSRGDECEQGFVSIFTGRDLAGWDGKPSWWYVEDGAITAQSTPDKPCKKHTYLIWRGGTPGDFELRLEYRLIGGNSGIQFRSREVPDWDTNGYQADMDATGEWTGALFEHTRGGIALRGQRVVVEEDGTRLVSQIGDPARLLQKVRPNDWNDYRIVVRGERLVLEINGVLMAEAIDRQRGQAARRGILALQLHPGPPMKVQFRKLRIRIDDPGHNAEAQVRTRGKGSPIAPKP